MVLFCWVVTPIVNGHKMGHVEAYSATNPGRLQVQKRQKEMFLCELFAELGRKLLAREKNNARSKNCWRNLWKKISPKTDFVANAGISRAPNHCGSVKDFGRSIRLFFPRLF